MIVQCEHCQTKYRIPDEKVKGKAAKVRCTKCNNTFTIQPEGSVPGAASAEKAPPVAETSPPAPEPGEPSLPESREPSPPEPEPEPAGAAGFEPETSPEQPASPLAQDTGEPVTEQSSTPTAPFETEMEPAGGETDGLPGSVSGDFEPPPLPEDADGTKSLRPAHEIDRTVPPSPAEDEIPQVGMDEFQIESTLREDLFEPQSTSAQADTENITGSSPSADEEMGWGNIALDSETDKQPPAEGIGLAQGADFQPPSPPPPIFDEETEEPPPPEKESVTDSAFTSSYEPEKTANSRGRTGLIIFLVLAALGAGGYFAYPKIMEIINPQSELPVGTLTPDKIQVRSLSREDGNLIYTVRGVVRNDSAGSVGMVQVEAQFRNTAGTIVAKSNVYCGNVFDDSEITSGDLGKILEDLQNELGQSLSNNNIQPGQDVPFLIILENPPSDVSKVTVTISGFKETT